MSARFEADLRFTRHALADARQYNVDVDRTGAKAERIYERLARARRLMEPWSSDGTRQQVDLAIEYLEEITSILTHKIGPASRREFREQGGQRDTRRTRRSPEPMIFEVHGPSARSNVTRYTRPEQAIGEASTRIYTNPSERARALARLEAGKPVTFTYGFSDVTIYVRPRDFLSRRMMSTVRDRRRARRTR